MVEKTSQPEAETPADETDVVEDISREVFRDLLARSVTFIGLTIVSVMIIGVASFKAGSFLKMMMAGLAF